MEKGQEIKLKIEDITDAGQGMGKIDNMVVFVNGDLVLGDMVEAKVVKVKKSFLQANLVNVCTEQKSEYREESFCQYGGICGGCLFHNTSYFGELKVKEKWVKDKLTRIGGLIEPKLNPIISCEKRFNYRNKAVVQIRNTMNKKGEGSIKIGFFRKRSKDIVDCKVCRIQEESVDIIAETLRGLGSVISNRITSVTIKTSLDNSGVMVDFYVDDYKAKRKKSEEAIGFLGNPQIVIDTLFEALEKAEYTLESVYVNGEICAAGNQVLKERVGHLDCEISPLSFYQVNTTMAEELLDLTKKYVNTSREEEKSLTILDLYCGVGTVGLYVSGREDDLFGIEVLKEAVVNANRNAVINANTKALFYSGKAEEILMGIALDDEEKFDSRIGQENARKIKAAEVIIIDPPRTGCHSELIEAVASTKCKALVYISCDPGTLARDIKSFCEEGFEFVEGTPVDMFPGTGNVECVCLLKRFE